MIVLYLFTLVSAAVAALAGLMTWALLVGIYAMVETTPAAPALTPVVVASVIMGIFLIQFVALQHMRARLQRAFSARWTGLVQAPFIWRLLTTALVALLALRRLRRS